MSRKIRRSTIIPLLLVVYLCVMAWMGLDGLETGQISLFGYVATIVATLGVIYLLHIFLKKRDKLRKERLDALDRSVRAEKKEQKLREDKN